MSDFEKALEVQTEKLPHPYDVIYKASARWAREFTVSEICEWVESYSKKHDSESAGFFADKIEQHFKDRGGEK